jgi:geranylgeranyl diphosphate synthase, type II
VKEMYVTYQTLVEEALDAAIRPGGTVPGDNEIPGLLGEAMRYSLMAGGKRLRPIMLLGAYALKKDDVTTALPYAVALEMIHTYSLIHDDLPAMDDDDLRRGMPTCHKAYGEAAAILAGDGLLNMAYEIMLKTAVRLQSHAAIKAAAAVARGAGVTGMVAGQSLDVSMEGHRPEISLVTYIHRHKTADMFVGAAEAGLALAGGTEEEQSAVRDYGVHMGVAFQIVDDLLDIMGEEKLLGKNTGMDEKHGKLTWPACVGVDKAREDARLHVEAAVRALSLFEQRGNFLAYLAQSMLHRVQ